MSEQDERPARVSELDPRPVGVTSRSFSRHAALRAAVLARYSDVRFNDAGVQLAGAELVDFLADRELAITALERVDDEILAALPNLRAISKVGVGLDMLDLDALERRGVALAWSPGTNSRSVAELCVASILALLRRLVPAIADLRADRWRQVQGATLSGRTVAVLGFGNVGRELAGLLSGFGCPVLAWDARQLTDLPANVEVVDFDEALARADVVSVHLPLNAQTRSIIDAAALSRMRAGALLINTARGGLVDEEALAGALERGQIAGAALDVFACEPPTGSPLLVRDDVIATPHIGGSTAEAVEAMGLAAIAGLATARPIADLELPR